MSVYIKFNNSFFQVPNKITIGRGEPFQSSDLSFARNHASVIKNKKGIFICKTNKKLYLKINNKEIQDCKYHLISPGTGFYLGESYFEIYNECSENFKVIKNISFKVSSFFSLANVGNIAMLLGIISWGFAIYNDPPKSTEESFIYLFLLILIIGASLIPIGVSLLSIKLYNSYLKSFSGQDEELIENLILTNDGMTIFFKNKKNFSFKFNDVKSWSHNGRLTTIDCYNKRINIQSSSKIIFLPTTKNDEGELPYFLAKNIPNKEIEDKSLITNLLKTLSIFPILYPLVFIEYSESLFSIVADLILTLTCYVTLLTLLLYFKNRKLWFFYNIHDSRYHFKQNILLGLVTLGYLHVVNQIFHNYSELPKMSAISICANGNLKDCAQVDYKFVGETKYYFNKNLHLYAESQCQ